MACAPQRYLANDRNVIRDATLDPSSVLAVADKVLSIPVARRGTAEVRLTGPYAGLEEATFDVEVLDTTPADAIVTTPIFAGAGSSRLVDVAATGLPAQTVSVELVDAGLPAVAAGVSFEGVNIKARNDGASGNDIRIDVSQTGLAFADDIGGVAYALIEDLKAGDGGPTAGLEGPGWDMDTKVLGADNIIPASAHRISFGDDWATVYLAYKRYVDNKWQYHFVPEIQRDVPKGTPVKFVTGGRTVTVTDGVTTETYLTIETVYDLLLDLRTLSALVTVDGVVANDRTPTGQAARELLVRTDAHAEPSTGAGSAAAKGFESVFVNPTARTELIVATAYAVNGRDHVLARLGKERFQIDTSLGGRIGEAVTGEPFVDPGGRFGFTIPTRLPTGFTGKKGRFDLIEIRYQPRDEGVEPPPICPVSMTLGTEAVDQTITLRWTKRPSGACDCASLPKPTLGGECLGVPEEGGDTMGYSAEAIVRLKALYDWGNTLASAVASYVDGFERDGIPETSIVTGSADITGSASYDHEGKFTHTAPTGTLGLLNVPHDDVLEDTRFADDVTASLRSVLDDYEVGIQLIDEVTDTGLLADGWAKWDDALAQFIADFGASPSISRLKNLTVEKYKILVRQAIAYAGVSPLGKSDASVVSGDGCWRDYGDPYYFTVEGSERGGYAPLFPNHPYYSSARATEEGTYYSTKEFALQVNIAPACISKMMVDDEVILAIGDAGYAATYQVGDTLTLPVIAAQPLYLAGGRNDDSLQTWSVFGSVDGPFATWQFTPDGTGTSYADGGLSWDIESGGIPNEKGDKFTFAITGGHYRWRKNAGAWSGSIGIPVGAAAFQDGLSIEFVPGADPAFYSGDLFSFLALQPWAVSNVRTGHPSRWKWADESPGTSLDIDLLATKDLDAVALAIHTIPLGATLSLSGGATPAASDWTEAITWQPFLIVQPLSVERAARYLRLDIVGGTGGGIGWLWAGMALSTSYPADVQFKQRVRVLRGSAPLSQGGSALASARGVTVAYQEAGLVLDDMVALDAMFQSTKPPGGEIQPIILVPNILLPQEAVIGEIEEDELVFDEMSGEQRTVGAERRYSTNFNVGGMWNR